MESNKLINISKDFKKSCITIIEGSSRITTSILYMICIENFDNGIVFIDGSNVFNPYILNRLAKIRCINTAVGELGEPHRRSAINERSELGCAQPTKSAIREPAKPGSYTILSQIYIARAFTEYQFENLIDNLPEIIADKSILLISDLEALFNSIEPKNFYYDKFDKILDKLRSLTIDSKIATVIAVSGHTFYDTLIINKADRIIKSSDYDLGDIMGRTVPSFRYHLEDIISELSVFRRALHGEDKVAFDNLMQKARKHASSCSIVPTLDPLNCILLSILIEQQKEIESFKNNKNNDK